MADFSAVIRNALAKVDATDPAARQVIYEKARASITRKIESLPSKPPQAVIDAQYAKLDTAIEEVEADHAPVADPIVDDEPVVEPDVIEPEAAEPELVETLAEEPSVTEPVLDEPVADNPVLDEPAPSLDPEPSADIPPVDDDVIAAVEEPTIEEVTQERDPLLDILDDTGAPYNTPEFDADFPETEERFDAGADDAVERAIAAVPEIAEKPVEAVAASESVYDSEPEKSGARWGLLGGLVALAVVIGGLAYAAYTNQDVLKSLFSTNVVEDENGVPVRTVPSTVIDPDDVAEAPQEDQAPTEVEPTVESATDQGAVNKFTQRLTEDGVEVDEGPLDGTPQLGEGSSVSTQSEGLAESDAIAAPEEAETATDTAAPLPVGQRALFYEERTGSQAGTSFPGAAIWSVVQEEPGVGLAPEPSIRVESSVPDLGLVLEMVIKRNGDATLPASHIAELFFRVPDTFEGRGIADVQRLTLKAAEGDPGNALIAVPAPIDTNIFLIALNNADTAVASNTTLLQEREWIDIPMQYVSGRRALITLEKGSAGRDVFDEVFAYWEANPL